MRIILIAYRKDHAIPLVIRVVHTPPVSPASIHSAVVFPQFTILDFRLHSESFAARASTPIIKTVPP
jgi:hypothetical protein